jgi:hypothetical protein
MVPFIMTGSSLSDIGIRLSSCGPGTGRLSLSNILAYSHHNLDAYDLQTGSRQ